MEVMHSTNIVFDNGNGRESNEATETFKMSKPFRKMKSPKGSRLPKPSKSPWTGITGLTPIKGHQIDSPVRSSGFSILPPTPTFESPKLSESPVKKMASTTFDVEEPPSPVKERKRVSSTDSGMGIELPKLLTLDSPLSVAPSRINPKVSSEEGSARI